MPKRFSVLTLLDFGLIYMERDHINLMILMLAVAQVNNVIRTYKISVTFDSASYDLPRSHDPKYNIIL